MTEQEWLKCNEPAPLLHASGDWISQRKLRLFACACLRCMWGFLTEETLRRAVELGEKYADGLAKTQELREADYQISQLPSKGRWQRSPFTLYLDEEDWNLLAVRAIPAVLQPTLAFSSVIEAVETTRRALTIYPYGRDFWRGPTRVQASQANCFRHIVGNPFRPTVLDPCWLTPAVIQLAQAIYDDRAFDRMPILGDALEEAGCNVPEVLQHCRSGEQHVRGCYVVDLVLGKA